MSGRWLVLAILALGAMIAVLAVCLRPRDPGPRVTIDFTAARDELAGCAVTIDGQPVGRLEVAGELARASFAVGRGPHQVALVHPRLGTASIAVDSRFAGQRAVLRASIAEELQADGGRRQTVVLR